ncbi:MAG: hypothetical protein ACYC46_09670 [Acidobacteriaceae bacterium]
MIEIMSEIPQLTGFFLGAGFSYEVGMPLVGELTYELKETLTSSKVREWNESWRKNGTGFSDAVIEDFISVLSRTDMHYESILGYLETQQRRIEWLRQEYHGLYSWVVECVSHILIRHHTLNVTYIERTLRYLDGFTHFAMEQQPFWVFSLNHDVIVECLAAKHGIPVNSGFVSGEVILPLRDSVGNKIGELSAECIAGDQFAKGMPFSTPGTRGINLLKIHGALDVFTFNETGEDVLKLRPKETSVAGVIDALRAANEDLRNMGDGTTSYKTTNEITYADETGQVQYLRRSLLAGAYKFDKRLSQVLPHAMLRTFQTHIHSVSRLVCIGYGFGDIHINEVMRDWLQSSPERRLEIVNPHIENVPPFLLHVAPQVLLTKARASDYLDRAAGIVRSETEALEKRLSSWIRKQPDKKQADHEFAAFLSSHNERMRLAFLEKLIAFRSNGAPSAVVTPPQDIAEQMLKDVGCDRDACLKAFLDSRSPQDQTE